MTRVALVTGAGGGLGAALACGLAENGFAVGVHYRSNAAGADAVCQEIRQRGGVAHAWAGDLARDADAVALAGAVERQFGRLDVLVNNAGLYQERAGLELSEAEWYEGFNSTASPVFFTTRACLPLLRAARSGRVINIGDSACDRPGARDMAWSYHIGKLGVYLLTRSLAAAEAPNGVAFNVVSPGYLVNSVGEPDPLAVPAGRLGTFADIHAAVHFLALEAPSYLSGSHLVVSGGWNLR